MNIPNPETPTPQALLRLADQCVKCGYCLPACPTYAKTRHEAESPRGRIALIQGWLSDRLSPTPQFMAHLDRCLLCRACEAACPSRVAYGQIMQGARAQRLTSLPLGRRWWQGFWLSLLANARWLQAAARLSQVQDWLATRLNLGNPQGRSFPAPGTLLSPATGPKQPLPPETTAGLPVDPPDGQGRTLPALLRRLIAPYRLFTQLAQTVHPVAPQSPESADLDLFVGCTGASLQGRALAAALTVCKRLGLQARIPAESPCCGAIYRHQGLIAAADRARTRCAALYTGRPLIGVASACIAELRADPRLAHAQEICAYLDRLPWPETLTLAPLPSRVLVHEPCSHRHLLGGNAAVWRLLGRIPDIQLLQLPAETHCCGAAGTYLLEQPAMAHALLEDLIAHLRPLRPAIIVTTNPGCALHLLAGVGESGLNIEVCHPIELIARQLSGQSQRNGLP